MRNAAFALLKLLSANRTRRTTTAGRWTDVLILFLAGHMADTDHSPDPESPEWNVGWTIKRALRLHLGPQHAYLPWLIARDVVAALRLSKWRITKEPPASPHSTPDD